MVKKLSLTITTALLVCLLSGCAGLLLLASSFLAIGNLWGTIDNLGLFDRDTSKYNLYLDGYDTGAHPDPAGTLNLTGLPVGEHILSVEYTTKRIGFHTIVTVVANQQLPLGSITLTQGSVISGKVQRTAGVPLANVRVAAILGGGALLTTGHSSVELPTGSGETVIMGMTDASGNFQLGPAAPGQWLVTSAAAGSYADAAIVNVATGTDAPNVNLILSSDAAARQGTLSGTVTREGGGAIAAALAATDLETPFSPLLTDARFTALQTQVGLTLRTQPWFQWHSLATQTDAAGTYVLRAPAGAQNANAFKFGYRAKGIDVILADDQATATDFALPAL